MEICYITFRSVTYAQRGERVLQGAGIGCTLQRTPKWMEQQGCGYCLRLRLAEVHRAVELLREKNVLLRRVYVSHGDGKMKEMGL